MPNKEQAKSLVPYVLMNRSQFTSKMTCSLKMAGYECQGVPQKMLLNYYLSGHLLCSYQLYQQATLIFCIAFTSLWQLRLLVDIKIHVSWHQCIGFLNTGDEFGSELNLLLFIKEGDMDLLSHYELVSCVS